MDTITRLYADKSSEALGKPVIVENKAGAAPVTNGLHNSVIMRMLPDRGTRYTCAKTYRVRS